MKKFKSTIPPSERVSLDKVPQEAITALFRMAEDCRRLNLVLPVLTHGIDQLEALGDERSRDVAKVGRIAREYVEMMLLSFMHQLDGYDDREFFQEAQKPPLTAPRLYVSLEDVARARLEFYRQVDALRAVFIKAREAMESEADNASDFIAATESIATPKNVADDSGGDQ